MSNEESVDPYADTYFGTLHGRLLEGVRQGNISRNVLRSLMTKINNYGCENCKFMALYGDRKKKLNGILSNSIRTKDQYSSVRQISNL